MSTNGPNPEYHALDHKRRTIRLLDIEAGPFDSALRCHLRHADLSSNPEYVAVSYAWGRKCTATELLLLDGKPCYIRPSLCAMLQALRRASPMNADIPDPRPETFWIDTFCINQNNINERNHQVRLMGDIYRQAHHVIVWLGNESNESDAAFDFMHDCRRLWANNHSPKEPSYDTYNAIDLLCHRDYWFRAWIKQEIILATKIIVHCGRQAVSWEIFAQCCVEFMAVALKSGPVTELVGQRRFEHGQARRPLKELLQKFAGSQSSDSRDRVFALLGLASDCGNGKGIEADYALTPAELLKKVLLHCQGHHDVDFSSMMRNMLVPDSSYQNRLDDVKLLLEKYENSRNDVQLRLNARLLRNLAAIYTTTSDPVQYLKIKTCIVWRIVAAHYPEEPKRFEALFRGSSGIDQVPSAEINRSLAMQAALDTHQLSRGASSGSHKLYNAIIHLCQRATVESQASDHAEQGRSIQLFWELISRSRAAWHLGGKVDQILELQETRRLHLAHSLFSNIRNKRYHPEILRIMGYTTGCGCVTQPSKPERSIAEIVCPLERFGMYWIIFGVLWAWIPASKTLVSFREDLLRNRSTLYLAESGCIFHAWPQLRPILYSPVSNRPKDLDQHYIRLCDWWEILRDSFKGHCRSISSATDVEAPADLLITLAGGSSDLDTFLNYDCA